MSPWIHPTTGEIADCPTCEDRKRQKEAIEADLENVERELRAKRARITQLQKELEDARADEPEAEIIREVCKHWMQYHPRSKCPAGGKRWEKVRARLKDKLTAERICLAIDAAHAFPFELYGRRYRQKVKGSTERTDLLYICRDEEVVERLEKIALGVLAKSTDGLPAARELFAEAFVSLGDELAEKGVPGSDTLDRVGFLVSEWMKAPEKPMVPYLKVVA